MPDVATTRSSSKRPRDRSSSANGLGASKNGPVGSSPKTAASERMNRGHSSAVMGRSESTRSDTGRVYRSGDTGRQRVAGSRGAARMPRMAEERPIGWWVKRLDTLLEEAVDAVVTGEGLTRRHWQGLHSLATGAHAEADVRTALGGFPGEAPVALSELVRPGRGVRLGAGAIGLTQDGV